MDRYSQLVNLPIGKLVASNVGLPIPTPLERFSPGDPLIDGDVLLGAASGGRLAEAVARVLGEAGVSAASALDHDLRTALADHDVEATVFNPEAPSDQRFKALVFDATGITRSEQLSALRDFFSPGIRRVLSNGRMLLLGTPPEDATTPREHTAQRALEGFVRSLGKEARGGTTAQLVYVSPGAEEQLDGTLRFLLSPKSAFVDAQVVRVGDGPTPPNVDWERPLDGKVALVTGASRGIGAAIAATLARDGAHVVGLDVPALDADLQAVTQSIGGSSLTLDITDPAAPQTLVEHLRSAHGGVDVVVHNAGITRDRTIAAMKPDGWDSVIGVNLSAQEAINDALIDADGVLHDGARIVCVASISGIAGNNGQTNYATSKAGVIGMVDSLAPILAKRGATINAVAPGFIETAMTKATAERVGTTIEDMRAAVAAGVPVRRGGVPDDIANTVAFFAGEESGYVTGQVIYVDGGRGLV